jgi:hypothetical protein
MRTLKWIFVAIPALALAMPVRAQEDRRDRHQGGYIEWPEGSVLLAPKIGIALPLASMPGSILAGVEAAYRTPLLSRRLLLVAQLSWTRPVFDGAGYSASVHHFGAIAAVAYRLDGLPSVLAPYGGIGAGLFSTQATVEILSEGIERHESDVRPAIAGFAGLDMLSGIGALVLEVRAVYAPTNVPAVRGSSIEPLSIALGYRVFLPP